MDHYVQVVSAHPWVSPLLSRILAGHELLKPRLLPALSEPENLGEGAQAKEPRLFLLDSWSLGHDLNRFSRRLRSQFPDSRFLVLGAPGRATDEEILGLLYSGIDGLVSFSDRLEEELPLAIAAVAAGGLWMPNRIMHQYVRQTTQWFDLQSQRKLTARENQVLQLVVRRLSNPEIAEALKISERTVKFHVSNLFVKVGAQNRQALLRVSSPASPLGGVVKGDGNGLSSQGEPPC